MKGGKVCGEVRMRLEEIWDLPLKSGCTCFYTIECGNDCFYRSGCFETQSVLDNEVEVTVARLQEDSSDSLASTEWRETSGTVRFFLRGRVSQGVRLQVWKLGKEVESWMSDSCGPGAISKEDPLRGIPLDSECISQVSFVADSLRQSKSDYVGWLTLYPQGCVYLRLLKRRKVSSLELIRLNLFGATASSTVKRSSESESLGRQVTRSGSLLLLSPQGETLSPWVDVASTGYTADSIEYFIDLIAKLDWQLAEPFTERFLGGMLPLSWSRITALVIVIGVGIVIIDYSMLSVVVAASNLFMIFLLILTAAFSSDGTIPCSAGATESYAEVVREVKEPRAMAKSLTSDLSGLYISLLMILAVALQTLLDSTRFFRQPRSYWRSFVSLVVVWTIPWTLPKLWRVFVRFGLVLLVGSVIRVPVTRRILANLLGAVLVLTGRQRQKVMAPLRWVSRTQSKGNVNE